MKLQGSIRFYLLSVFSLSLLLCGVFSVPSHAEVRSYEIIKSDESDFIPYTPVVKPSHADDKEITQEQIDKMEENGWLYLGQNEETGVYEFAEPLQIMTFSTTVDYIPESSVEYTAYAWCDSVYMALTSRSGILSVPANTYEEVVFDYVEYGLCDFTDEDIPMGTTFKSAQIGFYVEIGGTSNYNLEIYSERENTVVLQSSGGLKTEFPVTCTISADDDNAVSYWKSESTTQTDHTSKYFTMTDQIEVWSPSIGMQGCALYPRDLVLVLEVDDTYITNQAIQDVGQKVDELNETVKDQTQVIEENHEETKGLLGTIIDGITSLPSKLWEIVSDGLKALFIPKDGWFMEQIRALNDDLSESFGFLWAPFDYSFQFIDALISSAEGGLKDTFQIDIPEIAFEMNGEKLVFMEAFIYDFKESVESNEKVYELVGIARTVIDFIFVIMIFVMGSRVVAKWFGFNTAIDWGWSILSDE